MQAPIETNADEIALKFSKSLADDITLSGRFYYWTEKNSNLPSNGVLVSVRSTHVKLQNGDDLGAAICVEAARPSNKDPGYYKVFSAQLMMIPKDVSVGDYTRAFLADVERHLEK